MTHLRSAVFLVLVLALPWALHAQAISMGGGSNDDVPRLEFGANYNFFHANAPPGQCGCFSMNGGSGTVVYNITPKWAAVADLTIGHATNVDNSLQNITIFNYLFRSSVHSSQLKPLCSIRTSIAWRGKGGRQLPVHNQPAIVRRPDWWWRDDKAESSIRRDHR